MSQLQFQMGGCSFIVFFFTATTTFQEVYILYANAVGLGEGRLYGTQSGHPTEHRVGPTKPCISGAAATSAGQNPNSLLTLIVVNKIRH